MKAIGSMAWAGCLAAMGCGAAPEDPAAGELTLPSERGGYTLALRHEEGGFRRGVNDLTVRVVDGAGRAAELDSVEAVMPSHRHEVAVPTLRREGDAWRVEDLTLTMPGRWQIAFRVGDASRCEEALVWVTLR